MLTPATVAALAVTAASVSAAARMSFRMCLSSVCDVTECGRGL